MNKNAKKLRELLKKDELIIAPGVFDAWSARKTAEAGFSAVYMSGACVAQSMLAKPDIGLASFGELAAVARNIVDAAGDTPVIADADNGYGGILNVMRTVKEYERAGIACIQLEDQVFPKRCGHMEGKEIISKQDMVAKVKAAIAAKDDPDTMILARTDANAVNGFDDAMNRAKAYIDAGADAIFFEAPRSIKEMEKICKELNSVPLLVNMVEFGKTPILTAEEITALGYKIAIYPGTLMLAADKAMDEILSLLKKDRTSKYFMEERLNTFQKIMASFHLQELRDLEKSFL